MCGPKTKPGITHHNSARDLPLSWAHAHVCIPLYFECLFQLKDFAKLTIQNADTLKMVC